MMAQLNPRSRKAGRFIWCVHSEIQKAFSKRAWNDGLTQQKLASLLEIDSSVMIKRLLGKSELRLRDIADLAWALGYDIRFEFVDPTEKFTGKASTKIEQIGLEALHEVANAEAKHAPLNSPHEAWSVIYEELEELREHVRADTGTSPEARKEAIQVAAMGIRYVLNLCETKQ